MGEIVQSRRIAQMLGWGPLGLGIECAVDRPAILAHGSDKSARGRTRGSASRPPGAHLVVLARLVFGEVSLMITNLVNMLRMKRGRRLIQRWRAKASSGRFCWIPGAIQSATSASWPCPTPLPRRLAASARTVWFNGAIVLAVLPETWNGTAAARTVGLSPPNSTTPRRNSTGSRLRIMAPSAAMRRGITNRPSWTF